MRLFAPCILLRRFYHRTASVLCILFILWTLCISGLLRLTVLMRPLMLHTGLAQIQCLRRYCHTYHLPVCYGGCLHHQTALFRIQIPIVLCDDCAACKRIRPNRLQLRKRTCIHKKNDRKDRLTSQWQRIDQIDSHIAFYLKGKWLGDGLSFDMNIVIHTTLLNIFEFIFFLKALYCPAGKVIDSFYPKHERISDHRIGSCVFHYYIPFSHPSRSPPIVWWVSYLRYFFPVVPVSRD